MIGRERPAIADLARAFRAVAASPHALADLQWLCWALFWRVSLRPAKRTFALPRLVRLVGRSAGALRGTGMGSARTTLVRDWFDRRSPLLPGNCLERSLVVHGTWASARLPSELHVGFRRAGRQTQGHTWVVAEGAVLLEARDEVARFESACVLDDCGLRVTSPAA